MLAYHICERSREAVLAEISKLPGDRLIVLAPGGAGIGDPGERDPALIARDEADELLGAI